MSKNLFKPRLNIKPYEYPELLEFKDAIRHSYWLHTEFNFTSDVNDFKTKISDKERNTLTRAILSIAQIEVSVKRFWGDLYKHFPKPEIDAVGASFAESEIRHLDAYSHLLEILGMNTEFEKITQYPCLINRINYIDEFMGKKEYSKQSVVLAVVLFSLLVEHISLFSQFLIIMSFNKHKNLFKGISNVIEATSKEEEIHAKFGYKLIEILKKEHPKMFDYGFYDDLLDISRQAFVSEMSIIDWIFSDGDLDFLDSSVVKNYITNRYNNSLSHLGINSPYLVDARQLQTTEWFDIEVLSTKENDFFYKRSIDYSKKSKQITSDDLF